MKLRRLTCHACAGNAYPTPDCRSRNLARSYYAFRPDLAGATIHQGSPPQMIEKKAQPPRRARTNSSSPAGIGVHTLRADGRTMDIEQIDGSRRLLVPE